MGQNGYLDSNGNIREKITERPYEYFLNPMKNSTKQTFAYSEHVIADPETSVYTGKE